MLRVQNVNRLTIKTNKKQPALQQTTSKGHHNDSNPLHCNFSGLMIVQLIHLKSIVSESNKLDPDPDRPLSTVLQLIVYIFYLLGTFFVRW